MEFSAQQSPSSPQPPQTTTPQQSSSSPPRQFDSFFRTSSELVDHDTIVNRAVADQDGEENANDEDESKNWADTSGDAEGNAEAIFEESPFKDQSHVNICDDDDPNRVV